MYIYIYMQHLYHLYTYTSIYSSTIHVYIYIYIYKHILLYTYTSIYSSTIHVYIYIYIYINIYFYIHIPPYAAPSIYSTIYIYIYIYICMYTSLYFIYVYVESIYSAAVDIVVGKHPRLKIIFENISPERAMCKADQTLLASLFVQPSGRQFSSTLLASTCHSCRSSSADHFLFGFVVAVNYNYQRQSSYVYNQT